MHTNWNIAGTPEYNIIERTQIRLTSLTNFKIKSRTNQGTSEGPETSIQEYSARRFWLFRVQVCWDPIFTCFEKYEAKKWIYKTEPKMSGFSSPRSFQWWPRNCRSPYGFFRELTFRVCLRRFQSSCISTMKNLGRNLLPAWQSLWQGHVLKRQVFRNAPVCQSLARNLELS